MKNLLLITILSILLTGCVSVRSDPFGMTEREEVRARASVDVATQQRMAEEAHAAAKSDAAYYWAHGLSRSIFWLAGGFVLVIAVICFFGLSHDAMQMSHGQRMKLIDHAQERWRLEQRHAAKMEMVAVYLAAKEMSDLKPITPTEWRAKRAERPNAWACEAPDTETGAIVYAMVKQGQVEAYRQLTG